ncbi:bestrophin family protein [Spirosoma endophyticum]|uniref:Putative membrane protein n=1 Tax=Spirosoma endophyticum TaxID=662367 RepID=A0A1I1J0N0_9BACT|nr:bestrophin family protein [Spirosoma endophyticum]SFC39020.1 putative membrane protein [Spirosoma endophyticum]
MIIYKNKGILPSIWHFHTGPTAKALIRRLAVVGIYVSIVTVAEMHYTDLRLKDTPNSFLGAMGILLSLLLIFRTNTAYDRFYEGRQAWGSLVNNCRNLAIYFNAVLPEGDVISRQFYAKSISNFPFALKNHLRDMPKMDELDIVEEGERRDLSNFDHKPAGVSNQLWVKTEILYREGHISESQHINLNQYLTALMDVCGICERIKSTPIPFSYMLFIKLFIMLYVALLPFTIIAAFGYLTVPAVFLTSYVLVGLEMIGEEIEEPFGLERNDLPLNQLSQLIRVNVHDILQINLPHVEKQAARPGFTVVT